MNATKHDGWIARTCTRGKLVHTTAINSRQISVQQIENLNALADEIHLSDEEFEVFCEHEKTVIRLMHNAKGYSFAWKAEKTRMFSRMLSIIGIMKKPMICNIESTVH